MTAKVLPDNSVTGTVQPTNVKTLVKHHVKLTQENVLEYYPLSKELTNYTKNLNKKNKENEIMILI
jgi:hypothetical protein